MCNIIKFDIYEIDIDLYYVLVIRANSKYLIFLIKTQQIVEIKKQFV